MKFNFEQLARCNKCFDILFDYYRNQFINYIQSSNVAKKIILQITKTSNIMNWIDSQKLASENRKKKNKNN